MDNRPIGIFDSGVGGITILKEIQKRLPNENYIYLGDTKNFPYGEKNREEIIKTMSANVKLGNNPFVRVIPLSLKKILVRLSYIEIRKDTTITDTNNGRIGIISKYQKYREDLFMLIAPEPVEKIKCSACTYENDIVFTFTSILQDNSIEKRFFEFLTQNGIKVRIESNGVLDAISTKN